MVEYVCEQTGTWQRLAVADLVNGGDEVLLTMVDQSVELVYSDPPWNPGNEKWWRRHAGVEPPQSYNDFLDAWCGAVAAIDPNHVVCEQSSNANHRLLFKSAIDRCPGWRLPRLEQWIASYGYPRRPYCVLHYGIAPLGIDVAGMHGESTTRTIFNALPLAGKTVVDPCTGLGMSSRLAHRAGANFIGTELNEQRLGRTIAWLLKHGYVAR